MSRLALAVGQTLAFSLIVGAILTFGQSVARADELTVSGYTNGCFGCVPPNSSASQTTSPDGLLSYSNATFSGTTANGFLPFGEGPAAPPAQNFNNFGSITNLGSNYGGDSAAGAPFTLRVTLTAPAGITGTNSVLIGCTVFNGTFFDFDNAPQHFQFAHTNPDGSVTTGSFDLTVNDVVVFPGETQSITGRITGFSLSPHVLINEFRLRGAGGATDEFIELYNAGAGDLTVGTSDGSAGWAVVATDGGTRAVLPNGTLLRAHGHYLIVNSAGYSLSAYPAGNSTTAIGDVTYTADIADGAGIALFATTTSANFTSVYRLDAVGFNTVIDPLYREGAGIANFPTVNCEYSFVRQLTTGSPQDTGDNAADFILVATDPAPIAGALLGAPGPENRTSPLQRNAQRKATLINPQAGTGSPNRERGPTPYLDALTPSSPTGVTAGVPNSTYNGGTLSIQRRFTNNTGQAITRLRYRVVDITTLNSTGAGAPQADIRWLTSNGVLRAPVGVPLHGITIDQPPMQQLGAALNSSGTLTLPGGSLAPGASVDVQFLLGVVQGGSFRFLVNVEALPGAPSLAAPSAVTRAAKVAAKQ
jgi:hypothetical protein